MTRNRRISVAFGAAALLLLALPQIALANFFNGGYSVGINDGCRQSIEVQNTTVVGGGSSSAWVMVDNTGGDNLAQVGWTKEPSFTGPRYFVEYHSEVTGARSFATYGAAPIGSRIAFSVDGDPDYWNFLIGGVEKAQVLKSDLAWAADENEYSAETFMSGDTCAGSSGNKNSFYVAQYKVAGVGYYNDYITPVHNKATFGTTAVQGSNSWETWDTRN